MEQLLNWMELNRWIVQQDWVVTAVCDMVAFLCLAGIAGVVARRRPAPKSEAPRVELPAAAPVAEAAVPKEADPGVPKAKPGRTPPPTAVERKDVKRALEAIGRWEHDYGKPRGLQELANMVEAKRNSQVRIPAAS